MFQAVQFPTGVAHLNASLADMDWNTFPHDEFWKKGFDTTLRQEFSESNVENEFVILNFGATFKVENDKGNVAKLLRHL